MAFRKRVEKVADSVTQESTDELVNNKESAYKIHIEWTFIGLNKNDDNYKLDSKRISYIMFNYEYFDKELPMGIAYIIIPTKIYKKVIDTQRNTKIKIKITGTDPNKKASIPETILSHYFDYVTVNQNQPYGINLDENNEEEKHRGLYLGLVDNRMTSYLRKPFNGIYRDISLQGLLSLAVSGYKVSKAKYVIEPFKYNHDYKQIIVPGCTTRQKFLEFLYDYDKFYDDYFNFFVDFKTVYLMSKSGNGGNGIITNKKSIVIDVRPIDDSESFKEGYTRKGNSYYVYVNQMDVSVNTNTAGDNIVNKVDRKSVV